MSGEPRLQDEASLGDLSIGFFGAGMMASALMIGLVRKKVVKSSKNIVCSDISHGAIELAKKRGVDVCNSNKQVCEIAKDVVILAVKPDKVGDVCEDIMQVESDALVVSIAAGVTLETMQEKLPGRRLVRVMPNTPCLVGEGACGYATGAGVTERDAKMVEQIFGASGLIVRVEEKLLDAVTGLSGSGPAYVFQFIEALSDGGVRAGLSRAQAMQLAAQTVKGAAAMVLDPDLTQTHPGQLKDSVCSAGGTTIAGVEALEKGCFRGTTISAVVAATKRSMQLGGKSSEEIERRGL